MVAEALVEFVKIRLGLKGRCQKCRRRMIDLLNAKLTWNGFVCSNRQACRLALQTRCAERDD